MWPKGALNLSQNVQARSEPVGMQAGAYTGKPFTLYFQSIVDQCIEVWWLSGKESACQAGDAGSIPGSGRSPGGVNGNSLQYCPGNPEDRGA